MPNLHVGGVKMRERKKGNNPFRVISQNKIKEVKQYEAEERSLRNNARRKQGRKVLRAGSLVRNK